MVSNWLETKVVLIDRTQEDLGITADEFPVRTMVYLPDVVSIRETISEETFKIDPTETAMFLRSGDDFVVKEEYDKLKEILKKVYEQNSNV